MVGDSLEKGAAFEGEGISVIIVSHREIKTLLGAIDSVGSQDFEGRVHLIVVGDNSKWRPEDLPSSLPRGGRIDAFVIQSEANFQGLPNVERVARLRNASLAFVREQYLCFLDDDNRWESNHLSSLINSLKEEKALASHSWRRLVDEDESPWNAISFPWGYDFARSATIYKEFVNQGVLGPESNVFRDILGIEVEGEMVDAVDMGAWLFHRSLFDSIRFNTEYTCWEIENVIGEDDKLLREMRKKGVRVACTQQPTLTYRLGGFSNKKKR